MPRYDWISAALTCALLLVVFVLIWTLALRAPVICIK